MWAVTRLLAGDIGEIATSALTNRISPGSNRFSSKSAGYCRGTTKLRRTWMQQSVTVGDPQQGHGEKSFPRFCFMPVDQYNRQLVFSGALSVPVCYNWFTLSCLNTVQVQGCHRQNLHFLGKQTLLEQGITKGCTAGVYFARNWKAKYILICQKFELLKLNRNHLKKTELLSLSGRPFLGDIIYSC